MWKFLCYVVGETRWKRATAGLGRGPRTSWEWECLSRTSRGFILHPFRSSSFFILHPFRPSSFSLLILFFPHPFHSSFLHFPCHLFHFLAPFAAHSVPVTPIPFHTSSFSLLIPPFSCDFIFAFTPFTSPDSPFGFPPSSISQIVLFTHHLFAFCLSNLFIDSTSLLFLMIAYNHPAYILFLSSPSPLESIA